MSLPVQILRLDLLMEPISAFISFIVAYYALKAYRLSSERGLLYLHLGFMILGVSMAARFVATFYLLFLMATLDVVLRGLLEVSAYVYGFLRIVAYGFFIATYVGQAKKVKSETVAAITPFIVNPLFDFISVTMLIYIVVQSAINVSLTKRVDGFLVFTGFLLVLLSHIFFMLALIRQGFYFIGHLTQLLGLVSMLTMLVRVSRSK